MFHQNPSYERKMNQPIKYIIPIALLCPGWSMAVSSSQALPMHVLTPDNRLDVGNAKILSSKLGLVCAERIKNQRQVFQCKVPCARLGDAVEDLFSVLDRANAPEQALKTSVGTLVRRTMRCSKMWPGGKVPQELSPFVNILKSMHNGKLPLAGKPRVINLDNVDDFGASLLQFSPQTDVFKGICESSLFKDNCIKSCDISLNVETLAKLLQTQTISSMDKMNKADNWVRELRDKSATLNRKSGECAKHFARYPPTTLVSLQGIGKTLLDKSNQVFKRQQEAERLVLLEQNSLKQQQRNAAKQSEQLAYQQDIAQMRSCREDSPFNSMSGCSYLTAVYDGDFEKAISIEYQSTTPYRQGWMGESYKEMSKMFGALYGGENKLNQDLADMWKTHQFISGLLGTYATYFEHYYPQCIDEDAVVVTLTTERQREYRNGFGSLVRTEQLPSKTDIIQIPRRLYAHVSLDKINKDTQASIQLADMIAGTINKFPRVNLYEVTMGLSSSMQRYACNSSQIKKLEQQMLKFQNHRLQYNQQFHQKY